MTLTREYKEALKERLEIINKNINAPLFEIIGYINIVELRLKDNQVLINWGSIGSVRPSIALRLRDVLEMACDWALKLNREIVNELAKVSA